MATKKRTTAKRTTKNVSAKRTMAENATKRTPKRARATTATASATKAATRRSTQAERPSTGTKAAAGKPTKAGKPSAARTPTGTKAAAGKPTKAGKPSTSAARTPTKPLAAKTPTATPAAASGDDRWWTLIDQARKGAEDPEEMAERLIERLAKELSAEDIIRFDTFVNERLRDAFRWDLWAVAYIMNGGCSDDGFDYFCGWLVGKGKAHYLAALANPEAAAKGVSADDEPFENEGMWYAASRAWEAKTGKPTDDFYAIAPRVTRSLQGEPFDEETVYEQHPALARKFGG